MLKHNVLISKEDVLADAYLCNKLAPNQLDKPYCCLFSMNNILTTMHIDVSTDYVLTADDFKIYIDMVALLYGEFSRITPEIMEFVKEVAIQKPIGVKK